MLLLWSYRARREYFLFDGGCLDTIEPKGSKVVSQAAVCSAIDEKRDSNED
jgi:hypothetical protein